MSNDTIIYIFLGINAVFWGAILLYMMHLEKTQRRRLGFGAPSEDAAPTCIVCDSEDIEPHAEGGYRCQACTFDSSTNYPEATRALADRCRQLQYAASQCEEARYLFESIGLRRPKYPSVDIRETHDAFIEALELAEECIEPSTTDIFEGHPGKAPPDRTEELRGQLSRLERAIAESLEQTRKELREALS